MTVTLQASRTYYPQLDGIRAVAIAMVFVSHYFVPLVPGAFGVDVFFFLSGFLITRLLLNELQFNGSIHLGRFYLRRALRLLPAMIVMIFGVAILWASFFHAYAPIEVLAALSYFVNYYIAFNDVVLPIEPLWSLAVEEHYYILFPVVVLCFGTRGNRLAIFLITFIILVTLWRYVLFEGGVDFKYIKHASDTRMDAIAWGALMAVLANDPKTRFIVSRCCNLPAVIWGGVLIIAGLSFALTDLTMMQVTARYTLTHIGLFLTLPYVLFSPDAKLTTTLLRAPIMAYVGRLSYSIYLYHLAVLYIIETANLGLTRSVLLVVCTGLTLFFAMASHHFIERPFLSLRRRMGSNASINLARDNGG